jgi:hypothetical protein
MYKIKNVAMCLMMVCFSNITIAADEQTNANKSGTTLRDPAEFQKVVDEFKSYVATVPPEIRDEVIAFRKQVSKLNREKKALYMKLTQESQNYLKKEQEYKKRLPLNRKKLISIDKLKTQDKKEETK